MVEKPIKRKWVFVFVSVFAGSLMSACSPSTNTWKEEILLSDNSKIVVERFQLFAGRREIGQRPPIKEHSIAFVIPGTSEKVTWKSEFSEEIGHSNFTLLALDIVNGSPYVVAYPTGCRSYNKWGRPNPPYVIFRYSAGHWTRIDYKNLPEMVERLNVMVSTYGNAEVDKLVAAGFVSAGSISNRNRQLTQPELKRIVRQPVTVVGVDCGVLVQKGTRWESPDFAKTTTPIGVSR